MSFEELPHTLPWELVEIIIGFLRSDLKSLRQACLVSRTWVPICRAHLFRRIVLHWCDDGTRRSNSLLNLLTHAPSIANYIRELSVHEGLISNDSLFTYCFSRSSSLPKLLHLLPHLRLFEFRASSLTYWCELSGELMNAVLHAATCLGLNELILGSWDFSFQPKALDAVLAAAVKNVRALTLTDIVTPMVPETHSGVGIVGAGDTEPPSQEPALKTLSIKDGASSMVPFCAQWFYITPGARIRSLHLSCATHQESISDLFRVLGTSLEDLELNIHSGRFHESNHPIIQPLISYIKCLETNRLIFDVTRDSKNYAYEHLIIHRCYIEPILLHHGLLMYYRPCAVLSSSSSYIFVSLLTQNAFPNYHSPMQHTGVIWIRCWAKNTLHVCIMCESGLNSTAKPAVNILRKRISAYLACFMLGFWMFSKSHGHDFCVEICVPPLL
jgi:hypothetical protein